MVTVVCQHCGEDLNKMPEPIPEPPEDRCSQCGIKLSEDEYEMLTDCTVMIASGEEGFAWIMQLWCSKCLVTMTDKLKEMGFKDHHHGSINFLEDDDCPDGYEHCKKQNLDELGDEPFLVLPED